MCLDGKGVDSVKGAEAALGMTVCVPGGVLMVLETLGKRVEAQRRLCVPCFQVISLLRQ